MPAPSNISAATATDLGTLPASVTQTVDDAGTTYTVWYAFTATETQVVGLFGFGDLSVYTPTTNVYLGPTGAPVLYLNLTSVNRPVYFLVESGTTYYFQFVTNGGNPTPASLTVALEAAPADEYDAGDIFVNGFNTSGDAFPGIVIGSTTDNLVKQFVWPMTDGENGDILKTSGLILLESIAADCLTLYSATFTELSTVAFLATSGFRQIRAAVNDQFWYVGRAGDGLIRTVLPDGSFGPDSWTVTASQVTGGIAANSDNTILYHVGLSNNTSVKRYDLVNSIALSDLAAGVANYASRRDIIVLEDDTILVSYQKDTATRDVFIRRYSAAGAVLNTYTIGERMTTRLARAIDSPDSFWVWTSDPTTRVSYFDNINVSTGAVISSAEYATYEAGVYEGPATATPERFGPDFSCPFLILRVGTEPEPPIPPDFEIEEDPIRWLRRSPIQASENRTLFINLFRLIIDPGVGQPSGDAQDVDPQVMFRFSTDNGKTYGNEMWRSMGRVGKWNTELDWWGLGGGKNWVLEVSGSAAVHTVLIDGVWDADGGTGPPKS